MTANIVTLESATQRLTLLPEAGGSVAGWDWKLQNAWTPLFRPWDGASEDRYTFACFPLVPWSNRITQGGFEHNGIFYPIRANRLNEPYPIHGDGWLQPWQVTQQTSDRIQLSLESHGFDGNPYHYRSTQTFTLLPNRMVIDLTVTHRGQKPLPYGLGLHPYFLRNDETLLQSKASGVWLSGDDPIPVKHTSAFPPTWDYNTPTPLSGPLIDNCFTGWDGKATIYYPERRLALTMTMADCNGYSLMYRPPEFPYFCFEPITHPIDAFHMPGQPGLAFLKPNETFALRATFTVDSLREQ